MCNRIHLVQNERVVCYPCHCDFKLTVYSSELPTSFRYLLPQDFPLCFILIVSSLPQQQIMAPRASRQGESGMELIRTTAGSSDTPLGETQLQCRHHLVPGDAANAATENLTLDAMLKIDLKTGSSQNRKQHSARCMCSWIEVHGRQQMIYHSARVRRELCEQFIATPNGKPPWSTKAFARTVREIENHDNVSYGIFADECNDKNPCEWTKLSLTTLDDATQAYMAEAIAESNL